MTIGETQDKSDIFIPFPNLDKCELLDSPWLTVDDRQAVQTKTDEETSALQGPQSSPTSGIMDVDISTNLNSMDRKLNKDQEWDNHLQAISRIEAAFITFQANNFLSLNCAKSTSDKQILTWMTKETKTKNMTGPSALSEHQFLDLLVLFYALVVFFQSQIPQVLKGPRYKSPHKL